MSQIGITIESINFNGESVNITFNPFSGGTINLGTQTIPYDYLSTNYEGDYSIVIPSIPKTCELRVGTPPSPTPTSTVTPTITPTPTPPVAFDPDAASLLADVLTAGGTLDATISAATDTLFTELKSNGFYNKLVFYPFIGGNSASHALFGKRTSGTTYDMTFNGGVTHSASGITMNGSNTNADWTALPWSASTAADGDMSMGIYSVNFATTGNEYDVGSYDSSTWPQGSQIISFGGDSYYGWNNSFVITSNTQRIGLHMGSMTGITSGTATFFIDGINVSTQTVNSAFTKALPVGGWLGADRGTAGFYSTKTYSWFYIGSYFTDTEMVTLEGIINDFQTSLGRNTYT